jgi:hypothetical protein
MQANVGPGKMIFAPAAAGAAAAVLLDGDLMCGAESLPVVCTYKYLKVVLAASCTVQG